MAFENIEDNQTKTADDATHGLLLASAIDGAKQAFMAAKHEGSRVDQPGRQNYLGKLFSQIPTTSHIHAPTRPYPRILE